MELLYKPDWEEAKERYKLWWSHEYFGRCAIAVSSPKAGLREWKPPASPENINDRWFDLHYIAANNTYSWKNVFYGGEAFPAWDQGYPGWASLSSFMGSPIELGQTTGWHSPIMDKGLLTDHNYKDLKIDRENKWWKLTLQMLEFSSSFTKGKALSEIGAFGGSGDTLASLRSTEKLLYDVMDCPEYVGEFDRHLMKLWMDAYDEFYTITRESAEGSTCWFRLWSPGKFYAVQNDFSYMLSPRTFIDVFIPTIEMQTHFLDHSVYHVDGVRAFAHVPALCELPRLQAIQILPGEGKPSPLYYMDVLKYVQSRGKNLHITISADQVEHALESLSARGLFISTVSTGEEEAKTILRNCEKYSRDRMMH